MNESKYALKFWLY